MNYSPISVNAHLGYCDFEQLMQDLYKLRPYTMTSFIDNEADAWKLDQIDDLGIRQIVRFYHKDDHQFHKPGSDSGWIMSPATFLNEYSRYGGKNRWLQVMNEPDGYSSNVRLLTWIQAVVDKTTVPLAIPGFGVGHPQNTGNMWSASWNDLCRTVRSPHIMSLHEYKPDVYPYRIGRFTMYLNSCAALGISPVPFAITEWGYDSLEGGDPLNGWRSRGITESQLYLDLVDTYRAHYEKYVKSGLCLGLHIFSYGDSGGWGNYRVDNARTFFSNLIASDIRYAGASMSYPPLLSPSDARWKTFIVDAGTGVNIRSSPTTTGNIPIASIRGKNNQVKLYVDEPSDSWVQIQLADGTVGWISSLYIAMRDPSNPVTLSFVDQTQRQRTVDFLKSNLDFFGIKELAE